MKLTRVVRLCFKAEQTPVFEQIFDESKEKIRARPGCLHLELGRDARDARVYYTISHWVDEKALEDYRSSKLFEETWAKTKILFEEKPMAFSILTTETNSK